MDAVARDFFKRILETPSPSGYERPVQEIVRAYVADFADEVTHRPARQRDRRARIPTRRCGSCSPGTATRSA